LTQISSYSRRLEATPQDEKRIEDLRREYEVGESQFHALLDKKQDATLAKGLAESSSGISFSVVEAASLPSAPYSPQRERLVLMGLFAGLGLGLALAFLVEQNDTTFATVDDFQAFTALPVAGVIPNVDFKDRKKGARSPIVTISDPDSVAAEQYRILAMKVQQQCDATQAKVVMIASAAGGEGKSLTAINLSTALAGVTEGPVLLLDADMRKPRVNEYLGITVPAGKGLYNLLVNGEESFDKFIEKRKDLYIIPGSVPTANPVAALSSPKARALFEQLRRKFAYIIVDAPPTLPIADSHILSGLSDKVLFVVRARSTPRELFQHAVESFDATNLLGAVVNDVDYQRSRYAYAYEYYKKTA
jgi:capsular exopolysaccharide synthesis family protein